MTDNKIFIDYQNDTGREPFDLEAKAYEVLNKALDLSGCPYPCRVSLLITDGPGIREYNKNTRGIDEETDVLSYPALEYEKPSDFSGISEGDPLLFDLDADPARLILGDILINMDRISEQAKTLGHSPEYEFCYMTAHSALHLLGWDHADDEEEKSMTEETLRIVS
ncbi:MAG: rRNA maturation RNase YbeY [Lachnospiraceae bacterium]|nr:rRNA maturation RNase YbeY [Lachnospiraceae bacterium]